MSNDIAIATGVTNCHWRETELIDFRTALLVAKRCQYAYPRDKFVAYSRDKFCCCISI